MGELAALCAAGTWGCDLREVAAVHTEEVEPGTWRAAVWGPEREDGRPVLRAAGRSPASALGALVDRAVANDQQEGA